MTKFAFIKILEWDFLPRKAQLLGIIEMKYSPLEVFPTIMRNSNFDIIQIMNFRYDKNRYKLITQELWDIEIVSDNKKLLSMALLA